MLQAKTVLNAKEPNVHINDLPKTKVWFAERHKQVIENVLPNVIKTLQCLACKRLWWENNKDRCNYLKSLQGVTTFCYKKCFTAQLQSAKKTACPYFTGNYLF